jgi:integrase
MVCIRRRRGRYVVDYRDHTGARRRLSFKTREEAEDAFEEARRDSRQASEPAVDRAITLQAYAERWLRAAGAVVKPSTLRSYEGALRLHVPPALLTLQVRQLRRGHVRELLTALLDKPRTVARRRSPAPSPEPETRSDRGRLSRNTVRIVHATLRAMLNAALDDGLIVTNPADRLGRALRLVAPRRIQADEVKAMTRPQVAGFVEAARSTAPAYATLFLLLARTGLRLGEAFALTWDDVDLVGRELRVARTFSGGRLGTPKSGKVRRVHLSSGLVEVLQARDVTRKAEDLRRGRPAPPAPLVFPNSDGGHHDQSRVSRAFKATLKAAALPSHFHPHSLRHTYAVQLIEAGAPLTYVRDQLGHSSIQVTADVYGRWLPTGDRSLVDRLDDTPAVGHQVVTAAAGGAGQAPASASNDWSRRRDLNPGPADYESAALPLSYAG